ncbi:MAG: hypothetical protein IK092_00910 [Muribaculaceae bacterium]|nr:hypothetical protein [Muribaculaceae bacterium]
MRNFIVFESGSRAGLSAELFFIEYVRRTGSADQLYLSDLDEAFSSTRPIHGSVHHVHDSVLADIINRGDAYFFPADELTRQCNASMQEFASTCPVSRVEPWYYSKNAVNRWLESRVGADCPIKIPATFSPTDICVRPNERSAGTRGVQFLPKACVTQRIDIAEEMVVDVLRTDGEMHIYPRVVTLKHGYDRFIKLLPTDGEIAQAVREFVLRVQPTNDGLLSDIFHVQIARDTNGDLYFIEASKRISGTAFVNILRGMTPFDIYDKQLPKQVVGCEVEGKFVRFEDLLMLVGQQLQISIV